MIYTKLRDNRGRKWSKKGPYASTGYFFLNNELFENAVLLSKIAQCDSRDGWLELLKSANGFFTIVRHEDSLVWAAVDRLRSVPLFYGQRGSDFFLSDDAYWVRDQIGDEIMDEFSCNEFLLTRYVTGADTLYPNVKQLRAGETIFVQDAASGTHFGTERYYRFLHQDYFRNSQEMLLERLDRVLVNVFKRLISSVKGRTILIPLSGGYDSRLVVLMLKRLGYERIICFTYGRPGNIESEISKGVASKLGFRWLFIPYSMSQWFDWFGSKERDKYYRFKNGLTSLPHLQDWPAIWEIKRKRLVPDDGIFVPGHAADFIAGSHIPKKWGEENWIGTDKLVREIIEHHYLLQAYSDYGADVWSRVRQKILDIVGDIPHETPEQAASAYECWDWQERQVKVIANSVRKYEFYGYQWRMPLWDNEMMSFWERVPLEHRVGKKLYNRYVETQESGFNLPKTVSRRVTIKSKKRIGSLLDQFNIRTYLRTKRNKLFWKRVYEGHPLGWYGIMPERVFKKLYSGRELHIDSFRVKEFLGKIEFR